MRFFIALALIALHSNVCLSSTEFLSDQDVTNHMIKYAKKAQTELDELEFKKLLQIMTFPDYFSRSSIESNNDERNTLLCLTCRSVINTLIGLHQSGTTEEELVEIVVDLCTVLQVQPNHVCRGYAELNSGIAVYLLENQPLFSARGVCGVLLQSDNPNICSIGDERYNWRIDIPPKNESLKKRPALKNNSVIKIAHITDTHYDPAYEAYGLAACDAITCCRKGQAEQKSQERGSRHKETLNDEHIYADENNIYLNIKYADQLDDDKMRHKIRSEKIEEEDRAGYWGDYRNCDSPWWAYEDGIDFISENHNDLEYIYYTGDAIDHGVWETTYEMIIESLDKTFNKLKEAFGDIPVFPGIGNHESQPTNQFAPPYVTDPKYTTLWLYDLLSDYWSSWIPEDTRESIRNGGYYTVLVKPGFRVVVLNTNLCYIYNWWIHLDPEYPSEQFVWLVEILTAAENAGEKVHILSHIPSAYGDHFSTCGREYTRIVERFSDVIMAEFNGHTHKDEFKIFYKKENGEPYTVAWNGGSLTAYTYVNPNYRIFEVDAATYDIVDAETWVYNLTEANLTPDRRPAWYKEYSFKEHYGIDSLSPTNMNELVQKMVTTDKNLLAMDYHKFRGASAPRWTDEICDDDCIKSNICYMVKTDIHDNERCDELWESFKSP